MPKPVLCPECRRPLAVLPGHWRVLGAVAAGQRVGTGRGVLLCHVERDPVGRVVSGCGGRWEVAPAETIRPVLTRAA